MAFCEKCGALVLAHPGRGGREVLVDARIYNYWAAPSGRGRVMTTSGGIVACTFRGEGEPTGFGFLLHSDTCGRRRPPEPKQERLF